MAKVPSLIKRFSDKTNYTFSNYTLFEEALTHPSVVRCRDDVGRIRNSERLEFLGDSVLNMVVSDFLFKMFPDEKEGKLSSRRRHLVDGKTLSEIAKSISLCEFIIKDKENGGHCNAKSLENAIEAIIGAIYIDSGYESAKEFVLKYWGTLAKEREDYVDPKSSLQQWSLTNRYPLPSYRTISETGPPHNMRFTVRANVHCLGTATAIASTKKEAQTKAAEMLLIKLNSLNNKSNDCTSESEAELQNGEQHITSEQSTVSE